MAGFTPGHARFPTRPPTAMSDFILAIDQGTTSSRAIVFDGAYAIRGLAQEEFAQHFPASGWVEHDPDDIWRTTLATARGALADAGIGAPQIAGHRHHQPARDDARLGPANRQADPQRHRLAGPPHRGFLRPPQAGRRRAVGHGEDGPRHRPLFLRHQDPLDARQRGGRARRGRGRPSRLRHRRYRISSGI